MLVKRNVDVTYLIEKKELAKKISIPDNEEIIGIFNVEDMIYVTVRQNE